MAAEDKKPPPQGPLDSYEFIHDGLARTKIRILIALIPWTIFVLFLVLLLMAAFHTDPESVVATGQ